MREQGDAALCVGVTFEGSNRHFCSCFGGTFSTAIGQQCLFKALRRWLFSVTHRRQFCSHFRGMLFTTIGQQCSFATQWGWVGSAVNR